MKRILLLATAIASLSYGVSAQIVSIPDTNFKAYLVGNTAINTNLDTEIQVSEATAFTGAIDCNGLGISDLTGIEKFTSLSILLCYNNTLTSLDITNNTSLTALNFRTNSISSIDVSNNPLLTILNLDENSISIIDISNNLSLSEFYCAFNMLSTLDLSNHANLTWIRCSNNLLTSLNIANGANTSLSYLFAHNNPNLTCVQVDDVSYSTSNWTGGMFNFDITTSFSENCSVGMNERKTFEVNIYPNPTSDQITIDSEEMIEGITIFNFFGQLVQQETSARFSVSTLPNGVYVMNIQTKNGILRSRFIKE